MICMSYIFMDLPSQVFVNVYFRVCKVYYIYIYTRCNEKILEYVCVCILHSTGEYTTIYHYHGFLDKTH